MKKTLIILVFGISGSGKSTLRDYIIKNTDEIYKLIAVTDRSPRTGEQDKIDKYFLSEMDFFKKKNQGELCIINRLYNTNYAFFKNDFTSGKILLGELHYSAIDSFKAYHQNTILLYIKIKSKEKIIDAIEQRDKNIVNNSIRIKYIEEEKKALYKLEKQGIFDYSFENNYDEESKIKFVGIIKKIIKDYGEKF
ncbi:hypothetical protein KHQ81_00685 [Mycoplasmatota bacterium]|nr:hypothetical protein KHQ81_00685 [Mycoplasmatota bacterium]